MSDTSLLSGKGAEVTHEYWVIELNYSCEFTGNEIARMAGQGLIKYDKTEPRFRGSSTSFKHFYSKYLSEWERSRIVTDYMDAHPDKAQEYLDKNYKGPVVTSE